MNSVVFILRLSHGTLLAISSHGFLICDDWIRFKDLALGVIFLEIIEADFNVEFTASGNNVLS